MNANRLRLQLVLGLLLSAFLLWLSLRSLDPREIAGALARANWLWFVPICLLTLVSFWVRAIRWGWILRKIKPIPVSSLFAATMIGFTANNLLPARLGEVVRPWALGKSEKISRASAFATIIVERVVDMFCILLLFAVALFLHPFPKLVQDAGIAALGVNLLLLAVLLTIERSPAQAERVSAWVERRAPARFAPKLASLLRNFSGGLGVFRSGPGLFWVTVHSSIMYAVTALGLLGCMWAFDMSVPWYAGIVMLVITAFGMMIAPTPGYLGAIQYACVLGLSLFGIDRAIGFSFSLYYHLTQFLPITVVGLIYLGRAGMSLGQVASASREEVGTSV